MEDGKNMKRNFNLIGISGKKQSGKDLVAKMLKFYTVGAFKLKVTNQNISDFETYNLWRELNIDESYYEECQIKKFATPIKEATQALMPDDFSISKWEANEEGYRDGMTLLGLTRRELLISVGNNLRNIDPDIFVKLTLESYIKAYMSNTVDQTVIISDVRFDNEISMITTVMGVRIRINRDVPFVDCPTETQLDDYEHFDQVIDNNGTIEELFYKVKEIWEYYHTTKKK